MFWAWSPKSTVWIFSPNTAMSTSCLKVFSEISTKLREATLMLRACLKNRDTHSMPASFLWDLNKIWTSRSYVLGLVPRFYNLKTTPKPRTFTRCSGVFLWDLNKMMRRDFHVLGFLSLFHNVETISKIYNFRVMSRIFLWHLIKSLSRYLMF